MPYKEILIYPEPELKAKADTIENIDLEIVNLADDMVETMYKAPGVGLAAPQVGCSKRLILVDPTAKKGSDSLLIMVNPVIIESEGIAEDSEMCLSVRRSR
jgi:peptide deformylase